MSEALDHVRQVCTEFDLAHPGWREDWERDKTRRFEKQQREIAEERERREARKARETAEKQQAASTSWYDAVDARIHEHLKNWLWKAIDERVTRAGGTTMRLTSASRNCGTSNASR